ncbi:MAG TPA: HAD family hydrolase [Candidatus Bathyarchaeia archaeon]|nr:HAD family hydrolase [Candidatus Bathyarchaeia archaeon]
MTVKAILFDMFDTLMLIRKNHDFYSPSMMHMYTFLVENGVNVPLERFQDAFSKARDELYAKADPNLEEPHFNIRIALTLKKLGYSFDSYSSLVLSASSVFCEEFMNHVYLDNDAESLLRNLYGKYKLGIVSNYVIPECVDRLLKKHGLVNLFDVVVVSGAVNKRKPSPEIFKQALNALGVFATETVFVGDTLDADIAGPKAVGMKTVYIKRREEKQIENVVPDETINSLTELPLLLK